MKLQHRTRSGRLSKDQDHGPARVVAGTIPPGEKRWSDLKLEASTGQSVIISRAEFEELRKCFDRDDVIS